MPTTASGYSYTAHRWTNSAGDPSIWGLADDLHSTNHRKPVLMYCHGNGGSEESFTNGNQYNPLRDRLIESGWVYVEALGGDRSNWGREFAMEAYHAALTDVAKLHPLGTLVLLGRSMGGCASSSLALNSEWGIRQHTTGLILESAVQSMYYRHVTNGRWLNDQYPEGRVSHGGDPQQFLDASQAFDPLRFPLAWYEDMPVQFIHGTHDDNVQPQGHAIAQYNRIKDHALYTDLYLRGLGTHSVGESSDPEILNPTWEFARRAQGLYPTAVNLALNNEPLNESGVLYKPGWRQAIPLTP